MADQLKYSNKLKDTKVLIIGGSSGIGYAVAEACLENGASVIISSSNKDRVESTISKLEESYPSAKGRVSGYTCNLGDESTIEDNVKQLFDSISTKLDHVVYTSGDSLAMLPLDDLNIKDVLKAGAVRFFGPLFVAKYAAKVLNPGPKSSITLTTGSVSERPLPGWTIVGSYATGLQGMTRGLALDLKPIRVNIVSPGVVDTNLWTMSDEQKKHFFDEHVKQLATGRIPVASDIAEAYLYVLKDINITGSMISTNGGSIFL